MKKVPKQDEQVNLLRIYEITSYNGAQRLLYTYRTKINPKSFTIPILTASCL